MSLFGLVFVLTLSCICPDFVKFCLGLAKQAKVGVRVRVWDKVWVGVGVQWGGYRHLLGSFCDGDCFSGGNSWGRRTLLGKVTKYLLDEHKVKGG